MAIAHSAPAAAATARFDDRRAVRFWLIAVAGLVFLMVLVGGATRLTESGLSITQWKPVTGVIPPLSGAEWQAEFDRYKQIPQFAELNPDMTLDGFKRFSGGSGAIACWRAWSARRSSCRALWFWWRGQLKGALGRAGRGRDRPAGARADRRLVDGDLGLERAHRGGAAAPRASSPDRRGDLRRADLRRGRAWRAAKREGGSARLRDFGVDLRRADLLPARPRRACRRLARRAHLQHLAADGVELRSGRGVPPEPRSRRSSAMRRPRSSTTGCSPTPWSSSPLFRRSPRCAPRPARRSPAAPLSLAAVALIQVALGVATLLAVVPIALALPHQALALVLFGLAVVHVRATGMERGPQRGREQRRRGVSDRQASFVEPTPVTFPCFRHAYNRNPCRNGPSRRWPREVS